MCALSQSNVVVSCTSDFIFFFFGLLVVGEPEDKGGWGWVCWMGLCGESD